MDKKDIMDLDPLEKILRVMLIFAFLIIIYGIVLEIDMKIQCDKPEKKAILLDIEEYMNKGTFGSTYCIAQTSKGKKMLKGYDCIRQLESEICTYWRN